MILMCLSILPVRSPAAGMVIGTTGFDEAGKQAIRDAAADIAIVFAPILALALTSCLSCWRKQPKWCAAMSISRLYHEHKVGIDRTHF
ncbi:hypothetical protein BHJ80_03725 [Escherichia coli]|nr:hypothetical protein BHJ80_03725 [Escherichia coli]